jgi:hypothetical protein
MLFTSYFREKTPVWASTKVALTVYHWLAPLSKDTLSKGALSKGALSKGALSKGALSKGALSKGALSKH